MRLLERADPLGHAIEVARRRAVAVAKRLGATDGLQEDIAAVPILMTGRHATRLYGCYQWLTVQGLGRITVYLKSHRSCGPKEIEDTISHELSHALVHWLWPEHKEQPHGPRWEHVYSLMKGAHR